MADEALVFAGEPLTVEDDRKDYREPRFITIGHLNGRMVLIAWTPRGDACRIVTNVIVQGEWAVVESLNRGTQTGTLQSSLGQFPPTGRYMEVRYCSVMRVKDGKVVKGRDCYDSASIARHLGLVD